MRTGTKQRTGDGTSFAPTAKETQTYSLNTCDLGPFSHAFRNTVDSNNAIDPCVSSLHDFGSPSHVARRVVPVHIFTVKGVLRRGPSTNLDKKILERLKTKFNAATAVIRKPIRVRTSFFSLAKGLVFGRLFAISAFAVCGRQSFESQTSTRPCVAGFQFANVGVNYDAAFARTEPMGHGIAPFASCITEYSQASENLAGQVLESSVSEKRNKNNAIFIASHLIKANSFNYLARAALVLQSLVRPVSILPQVT